MEQPSTKITQKSEESTQLNRQLRPIKSLLHLTQKAILQERSRFKPNFHRLPREIQITLDETTKDTYFKKSPKMNLIFSATSLEHILELIDLGIDINAQSAIGDTPFNFFIKSRQLALANALIDSPDIEELDVWSPDKFCTSPIMNALARKDFSLVIKILVKLFAAQQGSTLKTPNALNQTLFDLAQQYQENNFKFKRFIELFSLESQTFDNLKLVCLTPLKLSVTFDPNPEALPIIADLTNPTQGRISLILTMRSPFQATQEPEEKDLFDNTPDEILKLINNGMDSNAQSAEGETFFNFFITSGQLSFAHALIDNTDIENLDVWSADKFGTTPLMNALIYRDFSLANKILAKLFDAKKESTLQASNALGQNLLHIAAQHINKSFAFNTILEIFNTNQETINSQDQLELTPLMYAAKYNSNPDIIIALINAEQNPDIEKAVVLAIQYNAKPEIITTLIKKAPAGSLNRFILNSLLLIAISYTTNPEIIIVLIKAGANPNNITNSYNSPLVYALDYITKLETSEIIVTLIRAGADPNNIDCLGCTPLMTAILNNKNIKIIKTLLENGTDITIQDISKKTALDHAANNSNSDVLELLKKYNQNLSE